MNIPARIATVFVALAAVAAVPIVEAARPAAAPDSIRSSVRAVTVPVAASPFTVDLDEQYALEQDRLAVDAYLAAVETQRQIDAYLVTVEAERQAAVVAAAQPRRTSTGYHPGTTDDGECTGFVIPSYIIQRESGGNPSAYNPSGAYGCAQTLLSHYSSGSCAGLDPYTIQGQRDCVNILSNGGTNLNPWAATR